jgi:hypothetical protein
MPEITHRTSGINKELPLFWLESNNFLKIGEVIDDHDVLCSTDEILNVFGLAYQPHDLLRRKFG